MEEGGGFGGGGGGGAGEEEEEADEEEGRTSRRARGLLDASRSLLGCLLGASWRPLGASWGLLGPSWAQLGGLVGRLGGLLGASWQLLDYGVILNFDVSLVEVHVLSVKFSVIPMLRTHCIGELTDAFAKVFGFQ